MQKHTIILFSLHQLPSLPLTRSFPPSVKMLIHLKYDFTHKEIPFILFWSVYQSSCHALYKKKMIKETGLLCSSCVSGSLQKGTFKKKLFTFILSNNRTEKNLLRFPNQQTWFKTTISKYISSMFFRSTGTNILFRNRRGDQERWWWTPSKLGFFFSFFH